METYARSANQLASSLINLQFAFYNLHFAIFTVDAWIAPDEQHAARRKPTDLQIAIREHVLPLINAHGALITIHELIELD